MNVVEELKKEYILALLDSMIDAWLDAGFELPTRVAAFQKQREDEAREAVIRERRI